MGKQNFKRIIDWLGVINFHKEIVKRSEENFFSLPVQDNSANQWTSLINFNTNIFSGPWTIKLDQIQNHVFRNKIESIETKDLNDLYIGVPCWPSMKKSNEEWQIYKWNPIYYREVRLEASEENTYKIIPEIGSWSISPLLINYLANKLNLTYETDFDKLFQGFIEQTGDLFQAKNGNFIAHLKKTICSKIPEIENKIIRNFSNYVNPPSDWVLFLPTQDNPVNKHLLKDYELLSSNLVNNKTIGGLSILEDLPRKAVQIKISSLPIVSLNKSQSNAVDGILKSKPVTVISGPPGCGKSQVVLSVLLNAWSNGISVLFASNNNQAVDVVRERLGKFENDFSIAIRAGAFKNNNINEAFRSILKYISQTNNDNPSTSKQEKEKEINKILEEQKALQFFLDSKAPQKVEEGKNSALKAYSSFKETSILISKSELDTNSKINQLSLLKQISYREFSEKVFEPTLNWMNSLPEFIHKTKLSINKELELKTQINTCHENINDLLILLGIEPNAITKWNWPDNDQTISKLENWLDSDGLQLMKIDNSLLATLNWEKDFNFWKESSEVKSWISMATTGIQHIEFIKKQVQPILLIIFQLEKDIEAKYLILSSDGVKYPDLINLKTITDWEGQYSQLITLNKNSFDWLPLSSKSKINKRLIILESELKNSIPANAWLKIGILNENGREKLAKLLNQIKDYFKLIEVKDKYKTSNINIFDSFKLISEDVVKILKKHYALIESIEDIDSFLIEIRHYLNISENALISWIKKENYESTFAVFNQ